MMQGHTQGPSADWWSWALALVKRKQKKRKNTLLVSCFYPPHRSKSLSAANVPPEVWSHWLQTVGSTGRAGPLWVEMHLPWGSALAQLFSSWAQPCLQDHWARRGWICLSAPDPVLLAVLKSPHWGGLEPWVLPFQPEHFLKTSLLTGSCSLPCVTPVSPHHQGICRLTGRPGESPGNSRWAGGGRTSLGHP